MTPTTERKRQGLIIQARRKEQGETQESLADAIGLSQAFIGKLERGAANIDAMQVKNFTALLERLKWSVEEFTEATGIELRPLLTTRPGGKKQTGARSGDKLRRVGVYAVAQAGVPSLEGAEYSGHTYIQPSEEMPGLELYIAQGDSMTTADPESIHDGDVLHVDTHQRSVMPGRVYLIHLQGDGLTVKRVRDIGGELWLMSDNPSHAAFKPNEAEIIGRVVRWTRTIQP